jgi:hypothetical protein
MRTPGSGTAAEARQRRDEGHAIHIVVPARIKTHMSGGSVPEWADQIEQIEAEGWRFCQMTPTNHGDRMIFRRAERGEA